MMERQFSKKLVFFALGSLFLSACGGKYLVKTYPSDAKVYIKDLKSQEKRLAGSTPLQLPENSRLGDVFFMVFEKENYKPKEVMIKVNEGESLSVLASLDPIVPSDEPDRAVASKDDEQKPQQGGKPDEAPKDWKQEIADLKLRVALLENTTSFYKDAMFSSRMIGGIPSQDRDKKESVVSLVFQAQQDVMKGRYDSALNTIDKAIQMDEYSTHSWVLKGSVKYLMKDYEGAKIAWERSLKLDPYNKIAYKYLNNVYKILKVEPLPENAAELRYPASTLEIEKRSKKR